MFDRDIKTIGKHINNALKEELQGLPTVANFATTASDGKTYQVEYYNIEMITSIGYRVKSSRGVLFRAWANKVLKDYLLKGYSVNQRYLDLENRIDRKLYNQQKQIDNLTDKVDFVINSSIKPKEVILFEGQIWDAHNFATNLIKEAKERVILIDNYVDNYCCPLNQIKIILLDSIAEYMRLNPKFLKNKPPQSNREGIGGGSDASASIILRSASG